MKTICECGNKICCTHNKEQTHCRRCSCWYRVHGNTIPYKEAEVIVVKLRTGEGLSAPEISEQTGFSIYFISQSLAKYGVPLSGVGRRVRLHALQMAELFNQKVKERKTLQFSKSPFFKYKDELNLRSLAILNCLCAAEIPMTRDQIRAVVGNGGNKHDSDCICMLIHMGLAVRFCKGQRYRKFFYAATFKAMEIWSSYLEKETANESEANAH